jgi:prevent-host-death family protein
MKRVKIGEFRNRASEIIRRAADGETIIILNREREVARLLPITAAVPHSTGIIGSLAGTARIVSDIAAPIAPPDEWFRDPA